MQGKRERVCVWVRERHTQRETESSQRERDRVGDRELGEMERRRSERERGR